MVAQKFGNADPDLASRVGRKAKTKELSDKSMPMAGSRDAYSGLIGGPSNETGNRSVKKVGSYAAGGKVTASRCW